MPRTVDEIEREIRALATDEKRELLRVLLDELDAPADPDVEKAWLLTSQRRLQEWEEGTVEGVPGKEVMDRLRSRLRR